MSEHVEVILRSILAFSILLVGSRLLGKQTISQMNIFDFIASITLGAITANLAFNTSLKIHHMVLAFFILVFVILATAYLSLWNQKARKLFAGDPTVVIENGKILEHNMRKMRYTIDYLNQQLREKDVFKIEEVLYAIIETNGTLTVLKKPQFRNVTNKDLWVATAQEGKLPIELIMDGKMKEENLKENQLTQAWLQAELKKRGLSTDKVFYAVFSPDRNIYIDTYEDLINYSIDKE
ncbi:MULTISPECIES: DUF421 domain-containing protein [Bacillus]|uniref:DUF421 domain-containing protein n=1 Tax=Bacillus TaxID=1386 RepID=UPI0004A4D435|nr:MULTISPECIES: DUF421 domain-containing protein [Bacillus]MCK8099012.1 DUF421 domain-containing protein [Bacillus sp. 2CMS4F]MCW0118162.1 DUF421 domain-containing protein [Bacillus subtilis]MDW4545220.1 DUF421 domain-containing protein [Bacillus subtilis subsp. subtilis]NJI50944.1 DUF421 domain-containing protein [Bacillus subtilis]QGI22425.1 DUF421 domain-containing protein [Bacillus subtilis]